MLIKDIKKMEAYTPTEYVNDSEPDLDADNLNKTERQLRDTVAKANEIIDTLKSLISNVSVNSEDTVPSSAVAYKMEQDIEQLNSNIPSITFTIRPGLRDILDPSNKSGVYETNLAVLNLPLSAYGRAIISKNQENKWIYVEFLPTDLNTIYFNFYNGYSDIPGWIGWKKIPFQSI